MLGYRIFKQLFFHLEEETQVSILRNIFSLDFVSTFSFFVYNGNVFFRIYSEGVFYQFIFVFDSVCHSDSVLVSRSSKIVSSQIFLSNYVSCVENRTQDYFSLFVELLLCQEERCIYLLFRRLL